MGLHTKPFRSVQKFRSDEYLASMRGTGMLREFTKVYRRHRAAESDKSFMTYGTAMGRLRLALVPMLASGKPVGRVFDQVFR